MIDFDAKGVARGIPEGNKPILVRLGTSARLMTLHTEIHYIYDPRLDDGYPRNAEKNEKDVSPVPLDPLEEKARDLYEKGAIIVEDTRFEEGLSIIHRLKYGFPSDIQEQNWPSQRILSIISR